MVSGKNRDNLSKSKRKRKEEEDLEAEKRLASALFGKAFEEPQDEHVSLDEDSDEDNDDDSVVFDIDREGDEELDVSSQGGTLENISRKSIKSDNEDSSPAWVDEDDKDDGVDLLRTSRLRKLRKSKNEKGASSLSNGELTKRLRERYQSTTQITSNVDWAKLDEASSGPTNDTLGLSSAPLLRSSHGRLPASTLGIVRCPDANQSDPNQATVQSVHFHPASDPDRPLLLTAGLDKTLRFFQVGAEKSSKLHGIHFPKLPIYSASFLGDSGKVVVSGRRSFFYIYDTVEGKLETVPKIPGREEKSLERCFPSPDGNTIAFVGNDGYIILFDALSKRWMGDLKMNGSVRAITYRPDSSQILASGSDGDVYCWDLRTRKCIERFWNDDGSISSFLDQSESHLAVGAESGVVNLYSSSLSGTRSGSSIVSDRTKLKSVMNLRTSADMVRFNHDGQILAMSSRREKDSLKLLHVPSGTVFSNWPTSKTPLGYVWSLDFSPSSKYMALGNDKGKCLLYRLPHYADQ